MPDATSSTTPSARGGRPAPGPRNRREFRNIGIGDITRYRMPLAAIVSILHRISGALLFLVGIPVLLLTTYVPALSCWLPSLVLGPEVVGSW